ncbi:MAG: hypothetical protein ACREJN_16245 [Nitrospiraceae bacterium]
MTLTVRMTRWKRLYNVDLRPGDIVTVPVRVAMQLKREDHADHMLARRTHQRYDRSSVRVYDFTNGVRGFGATGHVSRQESGSRAHTVS